MLIDYQGHNLPKISENSHRQTLIMMEKWNFDGSNRTTLIRFLQNWQICQKLNLFHILSNFALIMISDHNRGNLEISWSHSLGDILVGRRFMGPWDEERLSNGLYLAELEVSFVVWIKKDPYPYPCLFSQIVLSIWKTNSSSRYFLIRRYICCGFIFTT